MKQVSIVPVWTIQDAQGQQLPARLIDLLVQVSETGTLQSAARVLGLSYRHAWTLVRQGEALFQAQLMLMERGKGSTLTDLGARIAWADRRIHARLRPVLETLSSELAQELRGALEEAPAALRIHASHGFAIERLLERLAGDGLKIAFSYASSSAAAAALRDGDCDVAGFHIPIGAMEPVALAHYRRWLRGLDLQLVDIAVRRQGLMVRAGNPKELFALADLARPGVRFINRQPGSGTRFLLERLLAAQEVASTAISGFEQGEYTHAAVAAHVASGMADAGFGLEPPARQFKLDFVPIATERYFLLCRADVMATPALQAVLQALRDPAFRQVLAALPGYDPAAAGTVSPLADVYPALASSAPE
ncbi:substrate-binding domain-containing protein [Pseudorhodoferax soli]|nr:substrate-binding domain-containing protein [Pseudorhodoferax soli]